MLLYQLSKRAIFFELLVWEMNNHHINELHIFWDDFEWFCREIRSDAKYFPSCPRHFDRGLIVVIVYYFQIRNKKEHSTIISRVMSSLMGPIYIEKPFISARQLNELYHWFQLQNCLSSKLVTNQSFTRCHM